MFFSITKHHNEHLYIPNSRVRGFTLVEALVAIFILTISITALMGVVSQSIFTSGYTKNKTVAIALAQEGVEMVRNIQDNILLNNSNSTSPFVVIMEPLTSQCTFSEGVCYIEPLTLEIDSCPEQICPPLRISDTGYFNYDSGVESAFTRSISILQTGQVSGKAIVKVEWMQGQTPRIVEYETELFLWLQ